MCAGTAQTGGFTSAGKGGRKVKSASRGVHGKRALEVSSSVGKVKDRQEHPQLWAQGHQERSHSSGCPSSGT